jgi:hypothetical protein
MFSSQDKHCDRKHRHEKHVCHVCCKEYVSKYRYILHANEKHKDMIKDVWEQCKTCLICYPGAYPTECYKYL